MAPYSAASDADASSIRYEELEVDSWVLISLLLQWRWITTTLRLKYLPHVARTMRTKYLLCKGAPEGNVHSLHIGAAIRRSAGSVMENPVNSRTDLELLHVVQ